MARRSKWNSLWAAGLCLMLGPAVFAEPLRVDTPNAAFLDLPPEGFTLLANELKSRFLDDLITGTIDDITLDLGSGNVVRIQGLNYQIEVTSLALVPQQGNIEAKVNLGHTEAVAKTMFFYPGNYFFETTCHDTQFLVSEMTEYAMDLKIGAQIQDGQISFQNEGITVGRDPKDMHVIGPYRCEGSLIVRAIKRFLVGQALSIARYWVGAALDHVLTNTLAEYEGQLNGTLSRKFPVAIDPIPPLGETVFNLQVIPDELSIKATGLHIGFSARAEQIETTLPKPEPELTDGFFQNLPKFATVGLNPDIINQIIGVILSDKNASFILNPEQMPELRQLLNRTSLASIWPDLTVTDLDTEQVQLRLDFKAPPRLSLADQEQAVRVSLPHLQTTVLVKRDGVWQDYYHVDLTIGMGLIPDISQRWLSLAFSDEHSYRYDGHWAQGYEPINPNFERDVFESILASLFDYLKAASPLYQGEIPIVPLRTAELTIDQLQIHDPWLSIDVVGAPPDLL